MKPRPIQIDGKIAIIPLTKGAVALIDAVDAPLVAAHNWHLHVDADGYSYARRSVKIDGRKFYAYIHHVVAGEVPAGHVPHHVDGDGLNNRRKNIEVVTSELNSFLARSKGRHTKRRPRRLASIERRTGSVRYVKRDKAWSAQFGLGNYRTREEAEAVRAWTAEAIKAYAKEKGPPVA